MVGREDPTVTGLAQEVQEQEAKGLQVGRTGLFETGVGFLNRFFEKGVGFFEKGEGLGVLEGHREGKWGSGGPSQRRDFFHASQCCSVLFIEEHRERDGGSARG